MKKQHLDRRLFLGGGASALGGLFLFSNTSSALRMSPLLARGEVPRTLVLLQLVGGNDGLNTLVPFRQDAYYAARPEISIAPEQVLRIDDEIGFAPTLAGLKRLYDGGHVAAVQGVGYPNPNRSHFKSFEIWHTANMGGRNADEGWVGRLAEAMFGDEADPNHVVHVGGTAPYSLSSSKHPPACFASPESYQWAGNGDDVDMVAEAVKAADSAAVKAADSAPARSDRLAWLRSKMDDARESSAAIRETVGRYRTPVEYPLKEDLGTALRSVAALMKGQIGTRIFSVELAGFDTHNTQAGRHGNRLEAFDRSLSAFLEDIEGTDVGDETVVLVFSEFGRRVEQNGSRGTDHGAAGPCFVVGKPVKGGLYGAQPSLEELDDNGDLVFNTDFRSVYAALIEDWMGVDASAVLKGEFAKLPVIETS